MEYLERHNEMSGQCCPVCGSEKNVHFGDYEFDKNGILTFECNCDKCLWKWEAKYEHLSVTLTGGMEVP